MGAAYVRWLVAKGNVFSPSAAAVAKLVEQLRKEGWVTAAGAGADAARAVHTVDVAERATASEAQPVPMTAAWLDDPVREELRLVWPSDASMTYPLTRAPAGAPRWALELHRAPEYVYPKVKGIGRLPTRCACGEDLAFEWDEDEVVPAFRASSGIFAECEACSRTFDPSKGTAKIEDPFGGAASELPGGAAYRFALVAECGETFARDASQSFAPALVALVEKEFGRAFYEIGAIDG